MRALRSIARAAVVSCALALPAPAAACGGFFCNAMAVDQSGERILFAYEPDGTVTTVVQIRYVGPSRDFAWVVPVDEVPEVSLGTAALFSELDRTTAPRIVANTREEGWCRDERYCGDCGPGTLCLDAGAPPPPDDEPVTVESRTSLGPYEVAVPRCQPSGSSASGTVSGARTKSRQEVPSIRFITTAGPAARV